MSLFILSNGNIDSHPVGEIMDRVGGDKFSPLTMSWVRVRAKEIKVMNMESRGDMVSYQEQLEQLEQRRGFTLKREDQGVDEMDGVRFFRGFKYAALITIGVGMVIGILWQLGA